MMQPALTDDDTRYRALSARDARFDGGFFVGVRSTGIYCRPVCRVRLPKQQNCRFFDHAAQAEAAGFRPCLRCRPELAPHMPVWSTQDASATLARQAARLLDQPETGGDAIASVQELARRLGVSERHLRRIFEAQFGVSPLQYWQTRRLLTAKQLLTDTRLPVAQIAALSGYASVRRFNAVFSEHYRLKPTELRRRTATAADPGIRVRLGYRPPYDLDALLGFFAQRSIPGVELVRLDDGDKRIARTCRIEVAGRMHLGWLQCSFDAARHQVELRVSDSLRDVLPLVIARVRATLDLDADPLAINAVLHDSFPTGDGLRVPGALDGFELAVRAILGQQITVAAARTLSQRLVQRLGEPLATPWPELDRLFPCAAVLAQVDGDTLGALGIVKQRQRAIVALAQAVSEGRLQLHGAADVTATLAALRELPGIGDWTAQYIAMRALRWPDAFPAGDVALHKALGVQGGKQPAQATKAAEAASQAWRPWRSYAVIRAWATLAQPPGATHDTPITTAAPAGAKLPTRSSR
jgi:AraC family transcriptional regulator of adaptative response / DNA-3-methyladenine glycosylase II